MGNFPLFLFLIMNLRIFYAKKFAGICKKPNFANRKGT